MEFHFAFCRYGVCEESTSASVLHTIASPLPNDTRLSAHILSSVVLDRASDNAPNVRAKSLELLSTLVAGIGYNACGITQSLLSLAIRRCGDGKPAVRKTAISLLQTLAQCGDVSGVVGLSTMGTAGMQSLIRLAVDESLSVRKSTLQCIHTLYTAAANSDVDDGDDVVVKLWLDTVLPMVGDNEATVTAKAIECVKEAIFDHVSACSLNTQPSFTGIRAVQCVLCV